MRHADQSVSGISRSIEGGSAGGELRRSRDRPDVIHVYLVSLTQVGINDGARPGTNQLSRDAL
jgi:hypothetical protein